VPRNGRMMVFISCSEKARVAVARPLRELLNTQGLHGVIVSEMPIPRGTDWSPEQKVDAFLTESTAMLALCTADDQHAPDGTWHPRQNVIDEIGRARRLPHLALRVMVVKEGGVQLPSNINPTWEHVDRDNLAPTFESIVTQLEEWGMLNTPRTAEPWPAKPRLSPTPILFRASLRGSPSATTRRLSAGSFNCSRG
jgi:predicted nucleotide-binding protein